MKLKLFAIACVITTGLTSYGIDQYKKGWPSNNLSIEEYKSGFIIPPKGYGNVPFYWWNGDSLKMERLLYQLNILSDASTDGLSVSYVHTHPMVDSIENAIGYGSFGRADAGIPGAFSDEWWSIWNKFSAQCGEKGIGLGLDDYVIGWRNNGYYVDDVLNNDTLKNYQGRLNVIQRNVKPNEFIEVVIPENTISITVYPEAIELTNYVQNGVLKWTSTSNNNQTLFIISSSHSPELHPDYGNRLVDAYFDKFYKKLDEDGRKGINYFFQDELHYPLSMNSWCEDMPQQFYQRKGYDIVPLLPAIFAEIGARTAKVRLDYADVLTQLAEERYFKPVFDWHNSHGLIYGCDNNGRGLEPLQYLDYFRAISWFTAPGNDAPARGSSFNQTKVSSSVSHLYNRPRTWLEAFHSMGWDSNGEWLTTQLDHHLIAGGNLLCLHGLYYSTHGGWWEWAPPCFHFRMPYWSLMKEWLHQAERKCFLLSQGHHVCDIAVLYPTEALQVNSNCDLSQMWNMTDSLSACGLDYDFVDFRSLWNASIEDGQLLIGNEHYKIIIIPISSEHHIETINKLNEFRNSGGIVLTGTKDIIPIIKSVILPDFSTSSNSGRVLHRKVGDANLYMVMGVTPGDTMTFRSVGKVEKLDPVSGKIITQSIISNNEETTSVRFNGNPTIGSFYLFTPGTSDIDTCKDIKKDILIDTIVGEWNVSPLPTMNNTWGDFRLPATNEIIGVESREIKSCFIPTTKKQQYEPKVNETSEVYGFSPKFMTAIIELGADINTAVNWNPYSFSWQYGVFDSPGSQGYHGLKGKVDNRFLIFEKKGRNLFKTYVYVDKKSIYKLVVEGLIPNAIYLDGKYMKIYETTLTKGWHELLLVYDIDSDTPKYNLEGMKGDTRDMRQRSAVVLYPGNYQLPDENSPYDNIVATKWYNTPHLEFSTIGGLKGQWVNSIETAPGAKSFRFKVNGKIKQLWINHVKIHDVKPIGNGEYEVEIEKSNPHKGEIVMISQPNIGYDGAAFFLEPIKIKCDSGLMSLGNWSDCGALKFYSGGMSYKKHIKIKNDIKYDKVLFDLGCVDASCEVFVNSKRVGILMNPPYSLDITDWIVTGDNEVEIIVYSSLSNHYQTIPSPYRGIPHSGLFGPVSVIYR
jgi:hypothetical protein